MASTCSYISMCMFELSCVCVSVCVCVCVCVCGVCVHVYVVYEDTNLYNDIVWYYKEKVIYEDIFSVPIIQNAYKSCRVSFLGGK